MTKYSVILGNLGNTCDRFLSSGYKDQPDKATMIRQASEIPGVRAVELVGTWDVTPANVEEVGDLLARHGLACASIIPDHFSQKRWGKGAFTSRDPGIRAQALDETMAAADMARKLGCGTINLWPGQDGYDYVLQADYRRARGWMTEAVAAAARAFPDIRFSLEYKCKEPRTHSTMARAADTLLLARATGCPNVGVTIDTGHALAAGENMAESAVLLAGAGSGLEAGAGTGAGSGAGAGTGAVAGAGPGAGSRLFHMHFNDNYQSWDDDMIVGSVHFVEYVELLFWLKEVGYDGWYSMDQYPYREDGKEALRASVEFLSGIEGLLDPAAMGELRAIVSGGDPIESTRWIRSRLFGSR